jgi:outer membrane protein assembly factor BamB
VLKKIAIAFVLILAVAAGLYLAGFRVATDGSGLMPRFVSAAPDYDALEADRARQRALAPAGNGADASAATTASTADAVPNAPEAPASTAPEAAREPEPPAVGRGSRDRWTDFRGPRRDGRYDGLIRTDWPAGGLPLLWKQPIGLGYASFAVADGRAFTIEQRRSQEVVAAYAVDSGRELWTHGWDGEFTEAMGGDGPRATPTYHDGRVYALGALGELRALDARTGRLVWRRNILDDAGADNLSWGMSGAPLVVGNTLVVLPGGKEGRSVAAYALDTGAPAWTALDDQQAYVSPVLATLAGVPQIVLVTATRVVGITTDAGRLLWSYPWETDMGINAAQPLLLGGDRVFISSGYGQGAAVFEVTRAGDRFETREIWKNIRMKNKFASSVLHDGYVYGLDEAILACIDPATGELKWKGGRYGYGQLLLAGDHLVVLTEDGRVALVRATPEGHQEIAQFDAIDGKTWNHPVIADGRLLVRNLREMAAFNIAPGP